MSVFFAPDVRASGPAVAGSTPVGGRVARSSAPRGNAKEAALPLGDPFCHYRALSPCSSTDGRAVVWLALSGEGFCGRHITELHALQASRRAA